MMSDKYRSFKKEEYQITELSFEEETVDYTGIFSEELTFHDEDLIWDIDTDMV